MKKNTIFDSKNPSGHQLLSTKSPWAHIRVARTTCLASKSSQPEIFETHEKKVEETLCKLQCLMYRKQISWFSYNLLLINRYTVYVYINYYKHISIGCKWSQCWTPPHWLSRKIIPSPTPHQYCPNVGNRPLERMGPLFGSDHHWRGVFKMELNHLLFIIY